MKIPAPYQKLDGSYAAVMDIKQHDKAKRLIGETFESDLGGVAATQRQGSAGWPDGSLRGGVGGGLAGVRLSAINLIIDKYCKANCKRIDWRGFNI